jgi:hypothetical protein
MLRYSIDIIYKSILIISNAVVIYKKIVDLNFTDNNTTELNNIKIEILDIKKQLNTYLESSTNFEYVELRISTFLLSTKKSFYFKISSFSSNIILLSSYSDFIWD